MNVVWEYSTDLFDAETIDRMAGHFLHLLAEIIAAPQRRVSELSLLGEAERRQVLVDFNQTQVSYPNDEECLHELFERAGRSHAQTRRRSSSTSTSWIYATLIGAPTASPTTCESSGSVRTRPVGDLCRALARAGDRRCSRSSRRGPPTSRWTRATRRNGSRSCSRTPRRQILLIQRALLPAGCRRRGTAMVTVDDDADCRDRPTTRTGQRRRARSPRVRRSTPLVRRGGRRARSNTHRAIVQPPAVDARRLPPDAGRRRSCRRPFSALTCRCGSSSGR